MDAVARCGMKQTSKQTADTALLLEVARESSLEFADSDSDYVTVHMDKATWAKLEARLP